MYDRDVVPFPERPTQGLRYRIETLIGVTGVKMAKYRCSWGECVSSVFDLVWRPHMLLMLICELELYIRQCSVLLKFCLRADVGVTFGFGIVRQFPQLGAGAASLY